VTILHIIILHKDASDIKDSTVLLNAMSEWNVNFDTSIKIFMAGSDTTLEFSDAFIIKLVISSCTPQ
jgi:hypothetical protein